MLAFMGPACRNAKIEARTRLRMPFLKVADHIEVHYELDDHTDLWRDAPVLVLQHGNGRSAKFWTRWVPYLSRHYRVVRPDMRGLGRSRGALNLERDITPDHL